MSLISGSLEGNLKKITKKDEEVLKACYRDYCEHNWRDKLSFSEFKRLMLIGHWDEELTELHGK
ncbi:hypothetical protein D4R42_04025 [bacterium]|nr:MAG: hypothetical protein D4R42_04025 [bacterium]